MSSLRRDGGSTLARGEHERESQRRGWAWLGGRPAPEGPPRTAEDFAEAAILAICSASVTPAVGRHAFERCRLALLSGATARLGFRHPGKAQAVDEIWRDRHRLFREYRASADKAAFLATLPWIGPVTRRSLARHLGLAGASDEAREVA
ncbi:MAG TPA: hypothetical protein VHG30_17570 [Microvirga sp.]|jgi:hypothetical protein|nr:hypothetical protein [Microvirga sp.]